MSSKEEINQELRALTSGYRWVILLVVVYSFVASSVAFESAPPALPAMIKAFSINDVHAGLIMSIVLIPGLFLSVPSGWLLIKYQAKKVGVTSLIFVTAASFFTSISNSFETVLLSRFILGVGAVLITITGFAAIPQWFESHDLGKAMGLLGTSFPLSIVITFPIMSFVTTNFGWRFPFYIATSLAIIATVLFLTVVKDGPYSKNAIAKGSRKTYFNLEIWKLGFCLLCAQGATFSFSTWAPTLFTRFSGLPNIQASFLASLSSFPTIFLVPLFGYLSDRMGNRRSFVIFGSFLMTIAFVSMGFGLNIAMVGSVLFLGLATAIILPAANSMPSKILGSSQAGIGFGIVSICSLAGAVLLVTLVGYLIDSTSSLTIPFLAMGFFSAMGVVLAFSIKTK
jgi:MFS family permease